MFRNRKNCAGRPSLSVRKKLIFRVLFIVILCKCWYRSVPVTRIVILFFFFLFILRCVSSCRYLRGSERASYGENRTKQQWANVLRLQWANVTDSKWLNNFNSAKQQYYFYVTEWSSGKFFLFIVEETLFSISNWQ